MSVHAVIVLSVLHEAAGIYKSQRKESDSQPTVANKQTEKSQITVSAARRDAAMVQHAA